MYADGVLAFSKQSIKSIKTNDKCSQQGGSIIKCRSPVVRPGELELAYASTIHKSQGSEYTSVLISVQSGHGRMLKRPLIYTAITRAKRRVQLVGDWEALVSAIQTADTERRNTLLALRVQEVA